MVNRMETLASKMPKALADEVDRLLAPGQYANRSEVLRVAVRALVAGARPGGALTVPPKRPPQIDAFYRRLRELAKDPRYRHRWVGLHRGEVVDSDDDHDALIRRILERDEDPIHVGFASENPEPRRIRLTSPIRARRT